MIRQRALQQTSSSTPVRRNSNSSTSKSQMTQRRQIGREPSASWEITSEPVAVPILPEKTTTTTRAANYPQHAHHTIHHEYYQHHHSDNDNNDDDNNHKKSASRLRKSTSLQDFHTVFRTPHHVPDSDYKHYLLGESARRRRQQQPVMTQACCAQSCMGFSIVAILFFLWVGLLLDRQPLYVKGALPVLLLEEQDHNKVKVQYMLPYGERLSIASTAYQAAFAYLVVMAGCIYTLHGQWMKSQWYQRRHRYQEIPDTEDTDSTTATAATGLPLYYDGQQQQEHVAYQTTGVCCQITAALRQWLTVRGWLHPVQRFRRKQTPKTV